MTARRLRVIPPIPPGALLRPPLRRIAIPLDDRHCSWHASATEALVAGVRAIGLRDGAEILMPQRHDPALAASLARAGLRVRAYPTSQLLEPDDRDLERLLDAGVRALCLVHHLGFAQDAARWRRWCDEHGVALVEDATRALGAASGGRPVGSLADAAVFGLAECLGTPGGAILRLAAPPPEALTANGDAGARQRLALRLLWRLGDGRAAAGRRAHYAQLVEQLGDLVPAPFDRLPDGAAPFALAVSTDAGERLAARGVEALGGWLAPPGTLLVPVHQELRPADIDRIAGAVRGRGPRPPRPELRLEPLPGFDALEDEWPALAQAAGTIFGTPQWLGIWWRHFGRGDALRLFACRDRSGRLVAVLPLELRAAGPLTVVRFAGHGPSDELGPVCVAADRPAVARALLRAIDESGADALLGEQLPGGAGWEALLGARVLSCEGSPVAHLDAGGWDAQLRRWTPSVRRSLQRHTRKLERSHAVRTRRTTAAETLSDDLDTLFALHGARWGDGTAFGTRDAAFHREFAAVGARAGLAAAVVSRGRRRGRRGRLQPALRGRRAAVPAGPAARVGGQLGRHDRAVAVDPHRLRGGDGRVSLPPRRRGLQVPLRRRRRGAADDRGGARSRSRRCDRGRRGDAAQPPQAGPPLGRGGMTAESAGGEPRSPGERPATLRGHAVATFATNFGAAVLSLVNVLVVAWSLGAAGRGEVAFLIAVSTLTTWIASIGIQEANANIGGRRGEALPRLATNSVLWALGLGLAGGLAVIALVAAVPWVGGPVDPTLLALTLLFAPSALLKLFLQFLLQSHYHFTITNIAWLAGPTTTAIGNSLLAVLGVLTVEAAIGLWVAGQTLSALLMCAYFARRIGFGRPDRALARESASFGLKTHVGHLAEVGNYRADQWIVGAIAGSRELGRYSIAVAWAELLFYIPGVIALLQRPDLVRADRAQATRLAAQSVRRGVVLSIAGAVVLLVAAPTLCAGIFGEEFRGAIDDLRVLALGGVAIAAIVLLGNTMLAQRRVLWVAVADGTALAVTVTLDILLIPGLGGLGAAIATTAAYTLEAAILAVVFVRVLGGRAGDLVPRVADLRWYSHQASHLIAVIPRRRTVG